MDRWADRRTDVADHYIPAVGSVCISERPTKGNSEKQPWIYYYLFNYYVIVIVIQEHNFAFNGDIGIIPECYETVY